MNYQKDQQSHNYLNYFINKGVLGTVAEKALHNYKAKRSNNNWLFERLHYFAVGHTFKQLFRPQFFKYEINEQSKVEKSSQYKSLQIENFAPLIQGGDKNEGILYDVLDNLRNINSHFLHSFDKIEVTNIDKNIILFLEESFWLSATQSCYLLELKKKSESRPNMSEDEKKNLLQGILDDERKIINYLKKRFYQTLYLKFKEPLKEDLKEKKSWIDEHLKTKSDWLKWILFTEVPEDFVWQLNINGDGSINDHVHNLLTIKAGTYLSFEASVFLLSMFLYKNEANQLVHKLKGFKKKDTEDDRSKLDLFTFYAKKFKSQDIDSEEKNLVYFRDIILYLNKYPLPWNAALSTNDNSQYLRDLKNKLIQKEISRCFPEMDKDKDFNLFAVEYLFNNNQHIKPKKPIYYDIINNDDEVRKSYLAIEKEEIDPNDYKRKNFKTFAFQYVIEEYYNTRHDLQGYLKIKFSDEDFNEHNKRLIVNKLVQKLIHRIDTNQFFSSYGRNNDRFIEYAIRYLAQINFFGTNAQFKMYQYYSPQEQMDELGKLKKSKPKNEHDDLKYHEGKIIYYNTYQAHIEKYPEWDMPFVVQNNAVYVKIEGLTRTVCLQRNVLIYLLENALYTDNPATLGQTILTGFYNKTVAAQHQAKQQLIDGSVNATDKLILEKILPSNLLHHYIPHNSTPPEHSTIQKLLKEAEEREKKYRADYDLAANEGRLDYFVKRNKGKNFKLRFVRKACNWMYFKGTYNEQVENANKEHHKQFHIAKHEFNDFCKWMYAFGEVPIYKSFLIQLFQEKGFLKNQEFKSLFASCLSLDELYKKVKTKFAAWVETHPLNKPKAEKFKMDGYKDILGITDFFINISNFREYLKHDNKATYNNIKNIAFLIPDYYLPHIEGGMDKAYKKQFNSLNEARLEDCLLYEMAMRYANTVTLKTTVEAILTQNVVMPVTLPNGKNMDDFMPYNIQVPFKDIEKYKQLVQLNMQQSEKNIKHAILYSLPKYYKENVENLKKIQFINNTISLADINKVNEHLITTSSQYIKILFALEEYFIWKDKLTLANANPEKLFWLDIKLDIPSVKGYPLDNRNQALHFNLPINGEYKKLCKQAESKFIAEEVPRHLSAYTDLLFMIKKVTDVFLRAIHDECYQRLVDANGRKVKDGKEKAKMASEKYLYTVIKKSTHG